MSDIAKEDGTDVAHELLTKEIVIKTPGYVYIYLSNDNVELGGSEIEVFFDDFYVEHVKSPIVQTNDYYPFGLTFNSYQRENSVEQKFKFQGQEHIDNLDLGWDSFKWRNHQPDIGRFFNVDPIAEEYYYNSTYAFSENKVTTHMELEGLEAVYIFDQAQNPDNKRVYTASIYVVHDDGKVSGPYRGSSYPNYPDATNRQNTLKPGTHLYNNLSGHSQGTQKGLNSMSLRLVFFSNLFRFRLTIPPPSF
jgi:RHS repeat-associated protein